ncbi:MAG: hypothetical protein CMJ78_15640 [Planctomycetaceae bacterium]|nr:hypothetical protein [Planctomycetaceae bacterium]
MLSPITVERASGADREAALALMVSQSNVDDLLEAAEFGEISLEDYLIAKAGEQHVGAGFLKFCSDGTAFVTQPVVKQGLSHDAKDIEDAILKFVRSEVDRSDCWIAHSLLEISSPARPILERNGFAAFIELTLMHLSLDDVVLATEPLELTASSFEESRRQRFEAVLESTYTDTRDCPEVVSLRTSSQALRGHELQGEAIADGWRVFQQAEQDVGIMLLVEHGTMRAWELAYIGICPEFRRQGYARKMLNGAIHRAIAAGMDSMCLCVDSRNIRAQRLYESLGFIPSTQQVVHARILRGK